MSSSTPAPRSVARAVLGGRGRRVRVSDRNAVAGGVLATALTAIALYSTGGSTLGPNTLQEIMLIGLGVGAGLHLLRREGPPQRCGALTFALFACLTLLSAVSIAWSFNPDGSWSEAGRTLSYLAVFGAASVAARLAPQRWPALLGAVAAFATTLSAYALVTKIFPGTFVPGAFAGRLSAPYGYWNATGLTAALGLPATLWLASQRERSRLVQGLTVPALALQTTVVVLSFSRSAVLAAVVGLGMWFATVPLRLRGALFLILGALAAGGVIAYGLISPAIHSDHASLGARITAGRGLGVVLLAVLVVATAVGILAAGALARVRLPPLTRRRVGALLLGVVGLSPVAALAAVALSSRGFTGEISHIWQGLTSAAGHVDDRPGRLTQLQSTRPAYFTQALKVFAAHPVAGVGAFGWAVARLRYALDVQPIAHAHSYLFQTLADFGIVGVLITVALLVTWSLAAARAVGHIDHPRQEAAGPGAAAGPRVDPAERAGMLTLACVVVAFGVQSLLDWTWFIPGTTIPVLLCAAWLSGRVPGEHPPPRPLRLGDRPARLFASFVLVGASLAAAWMVWQPWRAEQAQEAGVSAASRGDTRTAYGDLRSAIAQDPFSLQPRFDLSALLLGLGRRSSARAVLVAAVHIQPHSPVAWRNLGLFDLENGSPRSAVDALTISNRLNQNDVLTDSSLVRARSIAHVAP